MADYNALALAQIARILNTVSGLDSVEEGIRPAENCTDLPAVCYSMERSAGERASLSNQSETRTITFFLALYADPTTESWSQELVNSLDVDIRAAFESDNTTQTSMTNTDGVILLWTSPDTNFHTEPTRKINGADITVECEIRRQYGD